ncbi:hypothetical protein ACWELJ_28350 [Nocardia sp. NPDC004582]
MSGPDVLSCQATSQPCNLHVYTYDTTDTVTIKVNGTQIFAGLPGAANTPAAGQLDTTWTPNAVGLETITVQQTTQTTSFEVHIIDNNGPEAFLKRFLCNTGSRGYGCPIVGAG